MTKADIRVLWESMTAMFGYKFTSAHGNFDMNNVWLAGLQDLTQIQIRVGLAGCMKRKKDWPPSLPEFRGLCVEQANGLTHNTAAYKEFDPANKLDKPKSDNKAMQAFMSAFRRQAADPSATHTPREQPIVSRETLCDSLDG